MTNGESSKILLLFKAIDVLSCVKTIHYHQKFVHLKMRSVDFTISTFSTILEFKRLSTRTRKTFGLIFEKSLEVFENFGVLHIKKEVKLTERGLVVRRP